MKLKQLIVDLGSLKIDGHVKNNLKQRLTNLQAELEAGMYDDRYISVSPNKNYVLKPKVVKKYDVIFVPSGFTKHPALVFKVFEDLVYCITFTTEDTYPGNITKNSKSRLLENHNLTCTMIVQRHSYALENWVGIYDNKKEADMLIKYYKKFMLNLLK